MKRIIGVLISALCIVFVLGSSAQAASPHVIGVATATVSGNSLTVTADVAGLGSVSTATFSLSGTVDVNSRCYTKSGNKPQAANKQETVMVDSTATFDVRNGRTNATFTITPLSTLTCPGGQHVVIESFSYNLTLSYEGMTLATISGP